MGSSIFLALSLLLAAPAAAGQPAPAPSPAASESQTPAGEDGLEIVDCSMEYSLQSAVADKVSIAFINHNELPVTKIRFRIRAGQTTFPVMDMGSFKPGLKIHHDLNPPETRVAVVQGDKGDAGSMMCSVDAYTLSNGQTWISDQLRSELGQ